MVAADSWHPQRADGLSPAVPVVRAAAPASSGTSRTFKNFLVAVPESVHRARYDTVVVWCEAFGQFISAARYR